MKVVTKEVIKEISHSLMFEMSEQDYDLLEEEFQTILKQMSLIHDLKEVEEKEPMIFPYPVSTTRLRKDIASETLSRSEALKNAKDVVENQIRLPRVIK